jgi:hypothetical protein
MLDEWSQPPVPATYDSLVTIPEQPMVHQEEIASATNGFQYRGLARIHRHRDASHLTGIIHLQPIQSIRIIGDLSYPKV